MEDQGERLARLEVRLTELEREVHDQRNSIRKMEIAMVELQSSVKNIQATVEKTDRALQPVTEAYMQMVGAAKGADWTWRVVSFIVGGGLLKIIDLLSK